MIALMHEHQGRQGWTRCKRASQAGHDGFAGCGTYKRKHVELLIRFGKELRAARRMR